MAKVNFNLISGASVANAFLELGKKHEKGICPLKMQKLIYYANGYYLGVSQYHGLLNEYFEAWPYGPVLPSIYYEFKSFGKDHITKEAVEFNFKEEKFKVASIPQDDKLLKDVINYVWKTYSDYSAIDLSEMTHQEGTPWHKVTQEKRDNIINNPIPNETIRSYFKKLVE